MQHKCVLVWVTSLFWCDWNTPHAMQHKWACVGVSNKQIWYQVARQVLAAAPGRGLVWERIRSTHEHKHIHKHKHKNTNTNTNTTDKLCLTNIRLHARCLLLHLGSWDRWEQIWCKHKHERKTQVQVLDTDTNNTDDKSDPNIACSASSATRRAWFRNIFGANTIKDTNIYQFTIQCIKRMSPHYIT